ncbi:MAG TPA: MBL fold metallo-hydrolase [Bacteroidia bacterium]|nr:MBL fold metallo-hydrolase [Bacteroidia bacterium]
MIPLIVIILSLIAVVYLYTLLPKFGRKPSGKRLEVIQKSPNYKKGKFQNISHTPSLTEGASYAGVISQFFFKRNPTRVPKKEIPSIKTDLLHLPKEEDVLIWFGHSSYFIQLNGKRLLVDPVFSGDASPLPGMNKSFIGSDIYTVTDFPEIDYLLITHDHYDHLDYKTIRDLRPKIKNVICGLGVGAHLERWGYSHTAIIEKDWDETLELERNFVMHTTSARHFSGRAFARNNTLWLSFVIQTPTLKLFIGGDSGYDTHFTTIGNKYGPFDLAILENGQYDLNWKYIHALPDEVLRAAMELKAKKVLPVHSGKFALANHAWDEPLKKITALNKNIKIPLITPMIGEIVYLKNDQQQFKQWWEGAF